MKVAVTAHRPDKLYGYDMTDVRYMFLMTEIKKYLRSVNCTEAITGMALGGDLIFAQAVLELQQEGMPISLICAVPCKNHKAKWKESRWTQKYDEVLEKADEVVIVTDSAYDQFVMQTRNEWMVDRCDQILAIFNGTSGGTKNCIDYAIRRKKKVNILNPSNLVLSELNM